MNIATTSVCVRCGQEYKPTGRCQKYCDGCRPEIKHERDVRYCSQHKEERRLSYERYRNTHKDERSAGQTKWYIAHREEKKSSTALYQTTHKEERRERSRVYRLAHLEELKERGRAWNLAHPKELALRRLTWSLAHPERIKESWRKHDAKRRALGFHPLNSWFPGCDAHHINKDDVIHVPHDLHNSIYHNQTTGQGMVEMNMLAGQYLTQDWT